jgi:hypothetical protein
VKSFDADGAEIPSLSGPYTPELKATLDAAITDDTEVTDIDADSMRERNRHILRLALEKPWKAQPENTMGNWCVTVAEIPGTPADGNPPVAEMIYENVAAHVAELHNKWLGAAE